MFVPNNRTTGVDVKHPLRIAAANVAIGPLSGLSPVTPKALGPPEDIIGLTMGGGDGERPKLGP